MWFLVSFTTPTWPKWTIDSNNKNGNRFPSFNCLLMCSMSTEHYWLFETVTLYNIISSFPLRIYIRIHHYISFQLNICVLNITNVSYFCTFLFLRNSSAFSDVTTPYMHNTFEPTAISSPVCPTCMQMSVDIFGICHWCNFTRVQNLP